MVFTFTVPGTCVRVRRRGMDISVVRTRGILL
eukprot:COSAG02_NODE_56905_length_283_cov_0.798913_1_plen_31_part_10